MLPTAKLTVEKRSSSRRPKISLSDAMSGWNTGEKLVLAQHCLVYALKAIQE